MGLLEKIFGTHSEHELKRIYPIVDKIEALEPDMQKLSDEELRGKTKEKGVYHRKKIYAFFVFPIKTFVRENG